MSIVLDMLEELWNTEFYHKGYIVNFFGIPRFRSYKSKSVKATFYRLRNNNFIAKGSKGWKVTKAGKAYMEELQDDLIHFISPFGKTEPKNLLLMFDIPIEKKKYRDWLRAQLKEFDYIMIQQSVWIGPSPLPKDFKKYMKEIGLQKNIKTFRLAKGYNMK